MYKGNSVLIQNAAGKYLLQFRDGTAGINNPLTWNFFGGGAEDEEDALSCAAREMAEELCVSAPTDHFELLADEVVDGVQEALVRYKYPLEWTDVDIQEGAGGGFFTREEALQIPLTPLARVWVERFFS